MATDGPTPQRRHQFEDPVIVMRSAEVPPNATEMFVLELERRSGCPVDWSLAAGRIFVECEARDARDVGAALESMRWIWAALWAGYHRRRAAESPHYPAPHGDWFADAERFHGWERR